MRIIILGFLLVAAVSRLAAQASDTTLYHDARSGIKIPTTVGMSVLAEIKEFSDARWGVGFRYRTADASRRDVFVYPVTDTIDSDASTMWNLRAHFERAKGDVLTAQRRGWYRDVKLESEAPVRFQSLTRDVPGYRAVFTYHEYDTAHRAYLYLFLLKGHFVKIRASDVQTSKHASDAQMTSFVRGLLGSASRGE